MMMIMKTAPAAMHTERMSMYMLQLTKPSKREEENQLRATLKQRREAGEEDIIIKKGKIVKKNQVVQPRWADVRNVHH